MIIRQKQVIDWQYDAKRMYLYMLVKKCSLFKSVCAAKGWQYWGSYKWGS